MTDLAGFVVQESIHADYVSRHRTRDEAVAVIEQMVRDGLAEPAEFNVREIDAAGETVRVFGVPDSASPATTEVPERWSSPGREADQDDGRASRDRPA